MPRTDDIARKERLKRIHELFDMVKGWQGAPAKELIAQFGLATGCKRSTRYEYLEDLKDSGAVVEAAGKLWTKEFYHEKVQSQLEADARAEESRVRQGGLEAFMLEKT